MSHSIFVLIAGFVIAAAGCGREHSQPEASSPTAVTQNEPSTPVDKLAHVAEVATPDEEREFTDWVTTQLEARGASFEGITERKSWPFAPEPNTSIVLGLAKRPSDSELAKYGTLFEYFPYILLIQATDKLSPPRLLGLVLRTDLFMTDPKNPYTNTRPKAIQVDSLQIANNEHAFGVTALGGSLGNKSGLLYELIGLYRYRNGELTEIYRDVVWVFSKYSEPDASSCNVDLEIATQPTAAGGFYAITRQYKRSYLVTLDTTEKTVASCSLTRIFEPPYTQTWNGETGKYLDHIGHFLQWDDFGKGYFPR